MATKKTSTGKARPKTTTRKPAAKKAAKPVAAKPVAAKPVPAKPAKQAKVASAVEAKPVKAAAAKPKKAKVAETDSGRTLALAVAAAGLEHKALNVEIIDVRGKVDYADYVVVMSGRGERQVVALANHIERDLSRSPGVRCSGIEGLPQGAWVLMDYGDVIVHIFHEDTRGYYDVEALWIDAARVAVD